MPADQLPAAADTIRLERTYPTSPETIWDLWTTIEGIESWWAPDGFRVDVQALAGRPGGGITYTVTAVAPEQIAFMESMGFPLANESRKSFTEVAMCHRLAYVPHVDFVPGVEPYDHLTTVELQPVDGGTHVLQLIEPMHDPEWTSRMVAGAGMSSTTSPQFWTRRAARRRGLERCEAPAAVAAGAVVDVDAIRLDAEGGQSRTLGATFSEREECFRVEKP
jgi:uncharacterized protein YndB with AHSA1/START domain